MDVEKIREVTVEAFYVVSDEMFNAASVGDSENVKKLKEVYDLLAPAMKLSHNLYLSNEYNSSEKAS